MTLQPDQRVTIVSGSSQFDLVIAFADRYGPGSSFGQPQRTVRFTSSWTTSGGPSGLALFAEVAIASLEWEDGSRHGWNFKGVLTTDCTFATWFVLREIKGFYNSKNHTGFFKEA